MVVHSREPGRRATEPATNPPSSAALTINVKQASNSNDAQSVTTEDPQRAPAQMGS